MGLKEEIKAAITVSKILSILDFQKSGSRDLFYCPYHDGSKPTLKANDGYGKASCQEDNCRIKGLDIFDLIQLKYRCTFNDAMKLAHNIYNEEKRKHQLSMDFPDSGKDASSQPNQHDLIPVLKPLLKTHYKWLESILADGTDWAVDKFQIKSLQRSHIAIPVNDSKSSYVFIPLRAQDKTYYKGEKRTLQIFPQHPQVITKATKLLVCPGEIETIVMQAELIRRFLFPDWMAITLTNNFRSYDKILMVLSSLNLASINEVVIALYHNDEATKIKNALVQSFEKLISGQVQVNFMALPLNIRNQKLFFDYFKRNRNNLPYPLNENNFDHNEGETGIKNKSVIATRIAKAAADIYQSDTKKIDYLHSILCQVSIPRNKTDVRIYEHRNGRVSLTIEAGRLWNGDDWVEQPLPHGSIPRLILIYISSVAVINKSKIVEVGSSLSDFMKRLGYSTSGGKNGSGTLFKQQLQALIASRFVIGATNDDAVITVETKPFQKFLAWIGDEEKRKSMWPGTVELSAEFYDSLKEHAVPLDPRALMSLRHSSLAIDIYTWMASRLHRISPNSELYLDWDNLKSQFTTMESSTTNFNRNFKQAINQVLGVYPAANVEEVKDARLYTRGYLFRNSPPPVSKIHSSEIIITG